MQKILSTLKRAFRKFLEKIQVSQNLFVKYFRETINEQIIGSIYSNDNINIEYIKQWFENSVRHIRDFLDPEDKVSSREDVIKNHVLFLIF